MKKTFLLLPVLALALTACDLLDMPKKMDGMKETTDGMSTKMSETNESIRLQKVAIALEMINKPENQENLTPVPTGLLPGGKLFAESATTKEIIDYTYLILKQIAEVMPSKGLDADMAPIALTDAELAGVRQQKLAQLYSLMIIASYAQDDKVNAIINQVILGNDVRQKTGLEFLAMRAYFIRDVLLKVSMKVDKDAPETLDNSGAMNEALSWLVKLDQVSKLKLSAGLPIQYKVKAAQNLFEIEEVHNDETRKLTAQMWVSALGKAEEGVKVYNTSMAGEDTAAEVSKQNQAIATMKSYVDTWQALLH